MRRRLAVGLVLAAAAVAAARWLAPESMLSGAVAPGRTQSPAESRADSAKGDERFAALPARAPLGPPRVELFDAPPPPKPVAAAPVAETRPAPPAMPYRVAGRVAHDGVTKVVLAKGDAVVPVVEGDALEGGYRVDAIGANEVTLVYLPLGIRERLPMAAGPTGGVPPSAPAAAGGSLQPAQLRWDGPERVRAGSAFNVTLKITSNEPLRGSPLQLSYDAELLEALAVRPGGFYGADAAFSYRINPSGVIFVGASGPGASAADAELLIVTFKPIRPAPATEVKIASLQLQGAVGKPIAAEALTAYRTAIIP